MTADCFADSKTSLTIEPNVFLDVPTIATRKYDAKLVSIVGQLTDGKRPWLAIQALKRNELKSFRLQVIGDGPLRSPLENYVNDHGLHARVTFLGTLTHEDTLRAIAKSSVLVHPSIREGAAWVVGEAASVGVPAVVYENVGAATTVRFSDNGGVVCSAEGDLVEALARGVLEASVAPRPMPSDRWSADRLPSLLDDWWMT